MRAAYEMKADIKVIRRRHCIHIWLKQDAYSLRKGLEKVPDGAVVADLEEDEDGVVTVVYEKEELDTDFD